MRRRYHILDVFTDRAFAGNPLAVVIDSQGLDTAAMQAIAREFNLSETVFVDDPVDPVNSARARIFTPSTELPFAGHPTIGTAILLATLNAPDLLGAQDIGLVIEEPIGLVSCSVRHRRGEAPHARFEVPQLAASTGPAASAEDLASLFGLDASEIGFSSHGPSLFSAGVAFTFVPVASIAALGRARLAASDDPATHAYYLYTPIDRETAAAPRAFRTRMLARGLGVAEDPATGSAAAAFAGVLLANERLGNGDHDCVLQQGYELGRPSRIGLAFTVERGRLSTTTVGGFAVLVAAGTLDTPL